MNFITRWPQLWGWKKKFLASLVLNTGLRVVINYRRRLKRERMLRNMVADAERRIRARQFYPEAPGRIKVDETLTKNEVKALRASWARIHGGS